MKSPYQQHNKEKTTDGRFFRSKKGLVLTLIIFTLIGAVIGYNLRPATLYWNTLFCEKYLANKKLNHDYLGDYSYDPCISKYFLFGGGNPPYERGGKDVFWAIIFGLSAFLTIYLPWWLNQKSRSQHKRILIALIVFLGLTGALFGFFLKPLVFTLAETFCENLDTGAPLGAEKLGYAHCIPHFGFMGGQYRPEDDMLSIMWTIIFGYTGIIAGYVLGYLYEKKKNNSIKKSINKTTNQ